MTCQCAALVIAAPASGQGKTTVTATLARYYRNQGKQVRVFKAGPDFLDPKILERASGHSVYQLDLWMVGEQHCRRLLAKAAEEADLILIEGVMGLYDGDPSTADLATKLGIPVLAVIDASAMAQTFAAIAFGLTQFHRELPVAGVFANRIGRDRHYQMLVDALNNNMHCFGALARQTTAIPSRHLGLVQADEIDDLEQILNNCASQLHIDNSFEFPLITFPSITPNKLGQPLKGISIGIAKDAAFSFIYQANIDLLTDLGATLIFFSPLKEAILPEINSLYLPGGYPELHLKTLSDNNAMMAAINEHFEAGKPIVAECGGMLYLSNSLTDKNGVSAAMTALLPGDAIMQSRLAALALQEITINNKKLRGHTYHHSVFNTSLEPIAHAKNANADHTNEAVYQLSRLTASYIHFYFPSNPELAIELFTP